MGKHVFIHQQIGRDREKIFKKTNSKKTSFCWVKVESKHETSRAFGKDDSRKKRIWKRPSLCA